MKIRLLTTITHGTTTLEAGTIHTAVKRIPERDDTPKWHIVREGLDSIPVCKDEAIQVRA